MDTFAKRYLIVLSAIVAAVTLYSLLGGDKRVDELNTMLAGDSELRDYPYTFRVISLDNGVATMASPRSAEVPAMRFLRAAFPELSSTSVDDPAMMAAQQVLAKKQGRAMQLVESQLDVKGVRWAIDERWFNEHGVFLDY
ncbi:MAG: hypothetical protein V2I82_01805 [Halieaceae bacterium]|jgi:hypothetical protein|nr:hypothetical protein [Halieaceae bacterium]